VHDETNFTTYESCSRGFNLSNPEVRLEGPTAFCPHCSQRTMVDAESMAQAKSTQDSLPEIRRRATLNPGRPTSTTRR
jgi:hypothetical protein